MKKSYIKKKVKSIPLSVKQELWERCGGKCERCGGSYDWRGFHPHHVLRRSWGGKDELDNLVAMCARCHSSAHGIVEM